MQFLLQEKGREVKVGSGGSPGLLNTAPNLAPTSAPPHLLSFKPPWKMLGGKKVIGVGCADLKAPRGLTLKQNLNSIKPPTNPKSCGNLSITADSGLGPPTAPNL